MKKFATIATAALLSASSLAAQGTKPATAPAPATAAANPVIMSFGTTEVRESEFTAALESLPEEYQQFVQGPGKKQFAEDYLRMKVLAAEGLRNGLDKDPKVITQMSLIRDNTLANAQLQKMESAIVISDEDLQKAYDARKPELEKAKARHILIAFKGSPAASETTVLTEEQARVKAEDLRKQIAGGADFAELARAESDDKGSGAKGGDLGTFGKGQMVPEFDKAVFEGTINEVGPVVRTQFGFHVIQVQERMLTPLAELKPTLETELKQAKLQSVVQSMKDAAKPTLNEAYFAPVAGEAPMRPAPVVPPSN